MSEDELYRELFRAEAAKQNQGHYQGRSFGWRSEAKVMRLVANMVPGARDSLERTANVFADMESMYAELGGGN